jgi:hypothetical protein
LLLLHIGWTSGWMLGWTFGWVSAGFRLDFGWILPRLDVFCTFRLGARLDIRLDFRLDSK